LDRGLEDRGGESEITEGRTVNLKKCSAVMVIGALVVKAVKLTAVKRMKVASALGRDES
jgi:hypothetical protein